MLSISAQENAGPCNPQHLARRRQYHTTTFPCLSLFEFQTLTALSSCMHALVYHIPIVIVPHKTPKRRTPTSHSQVLAHRQSSAGLCSYSCCVRYKDSSCGCVSSHPPCGNSQSSSRSSSCLPGHRCYPGAYSWTLYPCCPRATTDSAITSP